MWLIFAFLSALFAGITAVLAKIGLKDTDSDVAMAVRTIVVLIFSWIMVFIKGTYEPVEDIPRETLFYLTLSGLMTGVSWICYFKALQKGPVNGVAALDKTSTVLTILFSVLLLGEALTFKKTAGTVILFLGTALMLGSHPFRNAKAGNWVLLASLSAVFAALQAVVGKIGMSDIDSTLGTALRTVVVLAMAWMMVFLTGKRSEVGKIKRKELVFILLSGVTTGASWLFFYAALQQGPASVVVPVDKLSILFTVLFSYLFLKEKIDRREGLGLFLVSAGTLMLI